MDELAITFTDEDAGRIHHPHDDAIIIILLIADYTTKRVLVDNGSSVDILYYRLPANEAWMRSTSSNMLALGGIRRNESTTCRNHYTTYSSGIIPAADSQGGEFPCGRLFIFL